MKLKLRAVALLLFTSCAWSNVIVNFTEQSDGVHVDASGSLDVSPFTYQGDLTIPASTEMFPTAKFFDIVPTNPTVGAYRVPGNTVPAYGTSSTFTHGTWVSGILGLEFNGSFDWLYLSPGYVSNSALTASAIFPGTLATYGFPVNDIVIGLPGAQTITFAFTAAPEPATFAMTGTAFLLAAWTLRRRRRSR